MFCGVHVFAKSLLKQNVHIIQNVHFKRHDCSDKFNTTIRTLKLKLDNNSQNVYTLSHYTHRTIYNKRTIQTTSMNARFNITINWFVFVFLWVFFFCQTALIHTEKAVVTPAVYFSVRMHYHQSNCTSENEDQEPYSCCLKPTAICQHQVSRSYCAGCATQSRSVTACWSISDHHFIRRQPTISMWLEVIANAYCNATIWAPDECQ